MKQFIRRKHRLEPSCYIGFVRVSITICIKRRKEIFVNDKVCNMVLMLLHEELQKEQIINWVYVFMPDHIHLILEGANEKSNILKAIKIFKQRAGFWFKEQGLKTLLYPKVEWQKSFYDYIHRKNGKLNEHIKYIFENPVRKGIVEDFREYKYSGSLDYEIEEIL